MILKLSPLDSPDDGETEKYPQHMPEVLRKWFRGSKSSLTLFWKILLLKSSIKIIWWPVFKRRIFQKRVREILEPLNHFLCTSSIRCGWFSNSPTSGLSIDNNFKIMTGTDWILWQEIGLVIVFSRLKHETHVEYSTVWGLRGHFRYQKNFFETFYQKSAFTVLSGLIWRTD